MTFRQATQEDTDITLSHVFSISSETANQYSTCNTGNIKWDLNFISSNGYAKIWISNQPIGETTCRIVPWTVTFDVNVNVNQDSTVQQIQPSLPINLVMAGMKNNPPLRRISKHQSYYDSENFSVENVSSVKLLITNIRINGLHKFKMKNFDSADADEDLVLDVNGKKLHCHSQILSWNSKIFRTMIEESKMSSEICLKKTIPVEDLRELLHYLYLPCEPVDDHNFRKLLHWGHKFEVNHIVRLCHQYMESLVLGSGKTYDMQLEVLLLSWKYSIEPLKNIYARKEIPLKSSGWMMKIVQTEVYQDMDKDLKLQMWEFLVKTFEC